MRLGVKAALADGELIEVSVEGRGGVMTAVGASPAGLEGIAVPGFVDLHINGIGGDGFPRRGRDDYRRAGEALARTGWWPTSPRSCRRTGRVRRAARAARGGR